MGETNRPFNPSVFVMALMILVIAGAVLAGSTELIRKRAEAKLKFAEHEAMRDSINPQGGGGRPVLTFRAQAVAVWCDDFTKGMLVWVADPRDAVRGYQCSGSEFRFVPWTERERSLILEIERLRGALKDTEGRQRQKGGGSQ